jgi:hypothetical protein
MSCLTGMSSHSPCFIPMPEHASMLSLPFYQMFLRIHPLILGVQFCMIGHRLIHYLLTLCQVLQVLYKLQENSMQSAEETAPNRRHFMCLEFLDMGMVIEVALAAPHTEPVAQSSSGSPPPVASSAQANSTSASEAARQWGDLLHRTCHRLRLCHSVGRCNPIWMLGGVTSARFLIRINYGNCTCGLRWHQWRYSFAYSSNYTAVGD